MDHILVGFGMACSLSISQPGALNNGSRNSLNLGFRCIGGVVSFNDSGRSVQSDREWPLGRACGNANAYLLIFTISPLKISRAF